MIRLALKLYRSIISRRLHHDLKKRATLGNDVTLSRNFNLRYSGIEKETFSVGDNSNLDGLWVIQGTGKIRVGKFCSFRSGTYVGSVKSIEIGNHVYGAENIFITDNNNHPVSPGARKEMTMQPPNSAAWKWTRPDVDQASVVINDNVWLGRNCIILKGVDIGEGSIVAAGAVVTKSVPPFSVVAGNPARVVKQLKDDSQMNSRV